MTVRIGHKDESLTLMTGRTQGDTQISPHGRWIACESSESGRYEIYVRSFAALGAKVSVSIDGGETARWSRSGRELFYRDPVRNRLMAVAVQTSPEFRVSVPHVLFALPLRPLARYLNLREQDWDVAPDGNRFLVIASPDDPENNVKLQAVVNWFDDLRQRVPSGGK